MGFEQSDNRFFFSFRTGYPCDERVAFFIHITKYIQYLVGCLYGWSLVEVLFSLSVTSDVLPCICFVNFATDLTLSG